MLDIVSSLGDLRHAGAEFLIADLQTAITFTDIALRSKDEAVIDRNRRNARKPTTRSRGWQREAISAKRTGKPLARFSRA